MKKIALIVEKDFYKKHVGVRNLIFSIYRTLIKMNYEVDFVTFEENLNKVVWSKIWIDKESICNNFTNKNIWYEGKSLDIYNLFKIKKFNLKLRNHLEQIININIGTNINIEKYTHIIFTVPWLKLNVLKTINIKKAGILYDLIPNEFVFTNHSKPFSFANEHNEGFKYFIEECDNIFSISNYTKNKLENYYNVDKKVSLVLPPSVPIYADELNCEKFDKYLNHKLNNLILASPFDKRKGLDYLPKILNELKEDINVLYIYGKQRCSDEELKSFFQEISNDIEIVWFESIKSETLATLFSSSKILIFPSVDEGLGLPLIEAQMYGCRVVCTKFESAKELLIDGYYYLENNIENDALKIRNLLNEDYDYKKLKKIARTKYNSNESVAFFERFLND